MAVIALSLPDMVILRHILKSGWVATFVAVLSSGILLVGLYLQCSVIAAILKPEVT